MKQVQNLSFKLNTKRNGKSFNEQRQKSHDKFERAASVGFKLRKQRYELESFSH